MTPRTPPSIGYLGWSRRGNLGDDVIEEALHQVLPGKQFRPLPHTPREIPTAVWAGWRAGTLDQPLVLGGGTAIGRRNWRYVLGVGGSLLARGPRLMLGAGVEDPRFIGRHSFSGPRELRRWVPLLRSFDRVTVRGPQSAQLLADVGVDGEVTGDPALLLRPERPVRPGDEIAVNLGFGDDLWGHDHAVVEQEFVRLLTWCAETGLRVVAVCMGTGDRIVLGRVFNELAPNVRANVRVTVPTSSEEFFDAVSSSRVMVAERLHAQVLAVAAGTPVVALEYQPKCRDFVESVNLEALAVRTDQLTPGVLADLAGRAIGDELSLRAQLSARIEHLRCRLRGAAKRVGAVVVPVGLQERSESASVRGEER